MEEELDKFETLAEKQADLKARLQNKVNSNSRLTKMMLVLLKLLFTRKASMMMQVGVTGFITSLSLGTIML